MGDDALKQIQRVVSEAMEERRGLIVYSRLQPVEMDRMARRVEREALDKIGTMLEDHPTDARTMRLRSRLDRMRDELEHLGELGQIRETSRQMQGDDIIWQAFEDIAGLLGVR